MRKILSYIVVIVIAFTIICPTTFAANNETANESKIRIDFDAPGVLMIGDVNFDQKVDNIDLVMLARYLVKLDEFNDYQLWMADVNYDLTVDNLDLLGLALRIVNTSNG